MQATLSEQEVVRRDKLMGLLEMGINPYPAPLYEITHTAMQMKEEYNEETKDQFKSVSFAGRIMSVRDMGKANFAVLQDHTGRIQIYIKRDEVCPG
jgi:lysyl-tRNA synthetase class 2